MAEACAPGGAQSVHSRGNANEPRSAWRRLRGLDARDTPGLQNDKPLSAQRVKRMDDFSRSQRLAESPCSSPGAVAALEDKIVQRATAAVLNAIYEEDFLGFSYGFRPRRGQHDALDALMTGISGSKVRWIIDADIQGFLDAVS